MCVILMSCRRGVHADSNFNLIQSRWSYHMSTGIKIRFTLRSIWMYNVICRRWVGLSLHVWWFVCLFKANQVMQTWPHLNYIITYEVLRCRIDIGQRWCGTWMDGFLEEIFVKEFMYKIRTVTLDTHKLRVCQQYTATRYKWSRWRWWKYKICVLF